MPEEWLIDGYNLLHVLRSQTPSKTELARERLFALGAEFASFKKCRTLLILDGAGDPGQLDAYRTEWFEAAFSQKVSADACIEKYLYERRASARLNVVTNDRAISNIARGGGACVLGCERFLELLRECRRENDEYLRKEQSRGHGFNRPFGDKLKDL